MYIYIYIYAQDTLWWWMSVRVEDKMLGTYTEKGWRPLFQFDDVHWGLVWQPMDVS